MSCKMDNHLPSNLPRYPNQVILSTSKAHPSKSTYITTSTETKDSDFIFAPNQYWQSAMMVIRGRKFRKKSIPPT